MAAANDFHVFRLRFLESRNVLLWNHEHVCRSLRVNVVKGKGVLVFVDLLRRHFAADYAAEQTIGHSAIRLGELCVQSKKRGREQRSIFAGKRYHPDCDQTNVSCQYATLVVSCCAGASPVEPKILTPRRSRSRWRAPVHALDCHLEREP